MPNSAVADDAIDIDLWDPSVPLADPYPTYRALRRQDPVHWLESRKIWVVTSHDVIRQMMSDEDTFHQDYVRRETLRSGPQVVEQPYFQAIRRMFFMMDGEDHQRIRPMFAKWFMGPTRTRDLIPKVERATDDVLDKLEGRDHFDIVQDFAHPIPLRVISEILEVPDADSLMIAHDIEDVAPIIESVHKTPEVKANADKAIARLRDYFKGLIAERRKRMGDDLLSAMIEASDAGSFEDEEELYANILLMYFAGHETTTAGLGLAVLALHQNPDQLAKLKAAGGVSPEAVDEIMRYDGTAQGISRSPSHDVVLGGKHIEAGSFILGLLGAGNRDPDIFPDPDRLDLARAPKNLLTFGVGAHVCIGNMLARAEVRIALTKLLQRKPNLVLETTTPPVDWFKPSLTRALVKLPASC